MKRIGGIYDSLWQWDNLRLAFHKARRGARYGGEVRHFEAHLEENLRALAAEIRRENVTSGGFSRFMIHDPKARTITAPCFRDRVLHHAIMNLCEPHFDRWLIFDSYACRKGKGRLAALQRATHFAGKHAWFVKMDIRKYFESIPHAELAEALATKFTDRRLLLLFEQLIASYGGLPGRGLPIGSLISQHLANFYLGPLDRLCKERLQIPGYVRYMDDFVLWHDDPAALRQAWRCLEEFLADKLSLDLKKGTHLNRTSHGMDFCGFRIHPGWRVLSRRSRRRLAARVREIAALPCEREQQIRAAAVMAFAKEGKSWQFRAAALARALTA